METAHGRYQYLMTCGPGLLVRFQEMKRWSGQPEPSRPIRNLCGLSDYSSFSSGVYAAGIWCELWAEDEIIYMGIAVRQVSWGLIRHEQWPECVEK